MDRFLALVAVAAGLAAGCVAGKHAVDRAPAAERKAAQAAVEALVRGDIDALAAAYDPALRGSVLRDRLAEAAAVAKAARAPRLLGFTRAPGGDAFDFELPNGKTWLFLQVTINRGAFPFVENIAVQPLPASMEYINGWRFRDKSWAHFLFLGVFALVGGSLAWAYGRVFRGPWKGWAWALVLAVGVGHARLNWTTGKIDVRPLAVTVLGIGAVREGPAGPWTFGVPFPAGALIFAAVRAGRRRRERI